MKEITYRKIKEISLDKNFASSFIKMIIWGISWIAGILLPFQQGLATGFDNIQGMFGTTCLVFCLSLMVEFLPRTLGRFYPDSKRYYAFLCLNLAWTICISFYTLSKENVVKGCLIALFIGTIVGLAMLIIGFLVSALCHLDIIKPKEEKTDEKPSMPNEVSPQEVFEQKLESGALGTTSEVIEGGKND